MNSRRDIYTVSRLAFEARAAIEQKFSLIWIEGEISNLSSPSSGHLYFTLKDEKSQVRCALFKARRRQIELNPENGNAVLIRARVTLYEGRSEFQLIVEQIEPAGEGRLLLQLERLKAKLHQEGLFDQQRKRPLPEHPQTVAIITSPRGAAIRDILTTLKRRYPLIKVRLFPTEVQGASAPATLRKRFEQLTACPDIDLVILARGGGSLEDLFAFNDEALIRTIAACEIPVIAGIGHESDWTLADLVADLRAATPTAAAELAVPDREQLMHRLSQCLKHLGITTTRQLQDHQQRVDWQQRRLISPQQKLTQTKEQLRFKIKALRKAVEVMLGTSRQPLTIASVRMQRASPLVTITQNRERLDTIQKRHTRAISAATERAASKVGFAAARLTSLNPLATLARGYAVVRDVGGERIISRTSQTEAGDKVTVQLSDGMLHCTVNSIVKDQ